MNLLVVLSSLHILQTPLHLLLLLNLLVDCSNEDPNDNYHHSEHQKSDVAFVVLFSEKLTLEPILEVVFFRVVGIF